MIDAWSGPPPTPQQFPPNEPNGIRKLLDKIKAVELQVKESTSNLLRTAGIYLTPAGMTIDSNLAITGTLSLPAGIIDNDALANPTAFGANGTSAFNFALSTTSTAEASMTIPIPAGFTRALVHATVNASVENTSAVYDYFYVRANISAPGSGGSTGGQGFVGLANGGWGHASGSAVTNLSGLTPGSITVSCLVNSGSGVWAAATSNTANVDATVTFLR